MNLQDIKQISYDFKGGYMTIHLKKKILHNNFMKDKINYKCDYKTFIEKSNIWLNIFKN